MQIPNAVKKLSKNARIAAAAAALLIAALAIAPALRTDEGAASAPQNEARLEARLEDILAKIDGAGSVRVFLTCEDADPSSVFGESRSTAVRGAIIVSSGARDIAVMNALREAAVKALGLPASSVGVFPME